MEPSGTDGTVGSGNTTANPTNPSRGNFAKRWTFTLNNYSEEQFQNIKNICGTNGTYILGREVGKEGTPHIQGYFECKKRIRAIQFFGVKEIHFEVAKGNRDQNIAYCSKEGNYETNFKIKKPLKIIEELKPWQKSVENIIQTEPDERSIYWFWDETGNTGKTVLTKYLCHKYNAIPVEGKKADILYVCAEFESECYIFDLSRTTESQSGLYDSIEKVKNGLYMCGKYESKPIVRNCPHVIVFANFYPDKSKLSLDRWQIFNIEELEAGGASPPCQPVVPPETRQPRPEVDTQIPSDPPP